MSLSTEDPVAVAVVAAIHAGDVAALRRLLAEHEWLSTARLGDDGPDAMSRTLLHVATDWPGHFPHVAETVRVLVEAGADVDARFVGPHEETPLHWAASSNDVEALEALLDAGADIEAPGAVLGGGPPLADARGFKCWDAASALVRRGAHVTLNDAATLGMTDRVEELLDSDTPPASDVTRAFWGACHGGRAEVAALLLERGADLDWIPPWEHLTPLDAAEREGATELVAWLRARGARSAADLDTAAENAGNTESARPADEPSTAAYVQGVHLQRTDENVREIAALAAVLGEPAGLDGLLDDLKYQARRSRIPARLLGRAVSDAYTWDAYDRRDPLWYPQGISTSADASDTEDIAGRKVLVTTWYSTGRDGVKRGSRVTFLDLETLKYRHVLLVNPVLDKEGNLQLRPMSIHAGGIVLGRALPPHRGHQARLRHGPRRRHHAGARRRRPPRRAGLRRPARVVVRPSLRPARPLHLQGVHRRRPRAAALLLRLPRPALGPAGAGRRRVQPRRPRPTGSRATSSTRRPGSSRPARTASPDRSRSTRAASCRCRAPPSRPGATT